MGRFLFIVQGEGRGHMTQALALGNLLREAGHEIVAVLVGKVEGRQLPAFFQNAWQEPLHTFESPNFVKDKHNKGIDWVATMSKNLWYAPRFLRSIRQICTYVRMYRPDVVVNFYELIGGLASHFFGRRVPVVGVGHQYLLEHPAFRHPAGGIRRWSLWLNTWLTAGRAKLHLALSFDDAYPDTPTIKVVAPLLRAQVYGLSPVDEGFFLAYVNNAGYAEEIIRWQRQHPEVVIHCFWDRADAPKHYSPQPNMYLHQLDGHLFLQMMARCRALLSTAGFESVCEAMVLGKPALLVPIEGQYEQLCNAHDAARVGAAVFSRKFDMDVLLNFLPQYHLQVANVHKWHSQGQQKLVMHLESLLKQPAQV